MYVHTKASPPGCRRNWLAINFCKYKLYMDVMSQQLHKEWMLD